MPVLHLREQLSTLAHFGVGAAATVGLVRQTLAPFYPFYPFYPLYPRP